jgi:hypothetical protein
MKQKAVVMTGVIGLLLALAALGLAGCVSSHSDVTYGPTGPVVRGETLRQIKIGRTSKEWLLGTLGEPSRTSGTPDGTEILTYVYTKKVDSRFDFCPFLDTHDRREDQITYVFELRDGIVTRFWKET